MSRRSWHQNQCCAYREHENDLPGSDYPSNIAGPQESPTRRQVEAEATLHRGANEESSMDMHGCFWSRSSAGRIADHRGSLALDGLKLAATAGDRFDRPKRKDHQVRNA